VNYSERYVRQIGFEDIGEAGQKLISSHHALVLGCGGLGSVSAELLVRMGIGHLTLVDRDVVEMSNLNRQSLFTESDAKHGIPKAVAAENMLKQINTTIDIDSCVDDVTRFNVEDYIKSADVIVDGTDNFTTRYLINEACVKHNRTWIYGSCGETYGMVTTIIPGVTPCFSCLFEHHREEHEAITSETAGIINPIVHLIASIQCAEVLKLIINRHDLLNSGVLSIDLWRNSYENIHFASINKEKRCPVCNYHQFDYLDGRYGIAYASPYGSNGVQINPFTEMKLDIDDLSTRINEKQLISSNKYVVRFLEQDYEILLFYNGRSIVKGTTDIGIARGLIDKYLK